MILSDSMILASMRRGEIVIDPFDINALGGNSYDVHLGDTILIYEEHDADGMWEPLDVTKEPRTREYAIGPEGYMLQPGMLYLASTVEYTETHRHVPYLDGKSSTGRLGLGIHLTAGRGDVGFCNHWTMELFVIRPLVVHAGMPIAQLTFHEVNGEVHRMYGTKPGTSYGRDPRDPKPQASRLWRKMQR